MPSERREVGRFSPVWDGAEADVGCAETPEHVGFERGSGTLTDMAEAWMKPPAEEPRVTTVEERGALLVDLLHLTDALPARRHEELTSRGFRELCAKH